MSCSVRICYKITRYIRRLHWWRVNKTMFYLSYCFSKYVLAVTCWQKHPSPPATPKLTQRPTLTSARKRCASTPRRTASWLSSCGPTPEPAAWKATTTWETGGPRLSAVRPRQQVHIWWRRSRRFWAIRLSVFPCSSTEGVLHGQNLQRSRVLWLEVQRRASLPLQSSVCLQV